MKRKRKSLKGILLIALLLCGILVGWKCLAPVQKPLTLASVKAQTKTAVDELKNVELTSHFALLVRLRDGEVLLDRGADSTIYPASLTKIMTAVVALEQLDDLEQTVTLSAGVFEQLKNTGASVAGFQLGESVAARDLLYGLMLPSGADAALALVQAVCGGEQEFAQLMNEKAQALQMNGTHFVNATGLHHPGHYTTLKDLSALLRYALTSKDFRKAFTSRTYATAPTRVHPQGILLESTMFTQLTTSYPGQGQILGGKTGYTSEAGLCLASLAKNGEEEYLLITAGAQGSHKTEPYHIQDAQKVFEKLFARKGS